MGQTNKRYPVMEVAIVARKFSDHVSERACQGDIIDIRNPKPAIGFKEANLFIWLLIEGLEENEMLGLLEQNEDMIEIPDNININNHRYDKRRYMIPFSILKKQLPDFDIAKASSQDVVYQPFRLLDNDTHFFLSDRKPLIVNGLIFDKVKGEFL